MINAHPAAQNMTPSVVCQGIGVNAAADARKPASATGSMAEGPESEPARALSTAAVPISEQAQTWTIAPSLAPANTSSRGRTRNQRLWSQAETGGRTSRKSR